MYSQWAKFKSVNPEKRTCYDIYLNPPIDHWLESERDA